MCLEGKENNIINIIVVNIVLISGQEAFFGKT